MHPCPPVSIVCHTHTLFPPTQIDLHQKSKVGLADLYEKEWLDKHRKSLEEAGQTSKELTEEEKEELKVGHHTHTPHHTTPREQVIQMWRALSSSLDVLSNFYYTPKAMPTDELQVRASQKAAISMEEAMPTAMSSSQALAPQDVQAPSKRKFEAVGETELTTQDRKKRRRVIKENFKAKEERKVAQKEKTTAVKHRIVQQKDKMAEQEFLEKEKSNRRRK